MMDVQHNLGGRFTRREAVLSTGPVTYFVGGDGPAYVHLHGAGGLRVSPALQALTRWFTVYMPLIPGFDGTPLHEEVNSFPELADMVSEFIDSEIGGKPRGVSGHAFGGRLAAWFGVMHSDQTESLIVQCPSGFRPPDQTIMPTNRYERSIALYPERVPDEKRPRAIIDANRDAGYSYHAPGKGVVDKTVFQDTALIQRLGEVGCLTLILQGAQDGVLPPESVQILKSGLPRANLLYVYDAGHLIDTDQPDRFVNLVRDFLTRGETFIVNPNDRAVGLDAAVTRKE